MTQARARALTAAALTMTVLLAASPVTPTVSAISKVPGATEAGSLDAAGTGGVAIDGSATATKDPTVTITIPAPASAFGTVRLSNDGGGTWLERPWTPAVTWSLIDPAAGGIDADGSKTVTVQGGDGLGTWSAIGSASILLDRTGPWIGVPSFSHPDRVVTFVEFSATDDGVGLARTEVSLDGVHWRTLAPNPFSFYVGPVVDLREGTIGGSWAPGAHDVYTRAVDKLGNITQSAEPATLTPTSMRMPDDPPASFEFPLPAVAGQLFTIKPVFDPGYTVPAGQFCQWRLVWGSSTVRLEGGYDATYGEVMFSVSPSGGVCAPWTFTLPFTPPLEYTWSLSINSGPLESVSFTSSLPGSFRAAPGTDDLTGHHAVEPSALLRPPRPRLCRPRRHGDVPLVCDRWGEPADDRCPLVVVFPSRQRPRPRPRRTRRAATSSSARSGPASRGPRSGHARPRRGSGERVTTRSGTGAGRPSARSGSRQPPVRG